MPESPPVNVNLIRAFEGPRHTKLEGLWDCVAEYLSRDVRLHVLSNLGARLCHADCLNEMWDAERARPERYAIFTEYDFLPNLRGWFTPLGDATPLLGVEYATRSPLTKRLEHHGIPGAWYLLVDKERVKELDFTAGGPFNDPANQIQGVRLMPGTDCYPLHYGISYPTGTHLFWSRHLHDDPDGSAAGFKLGDIQRGHDAAVEAWVRQAPGAFRYIARRRGYAAPKT